MKSEDVVVWASKNIEELRRSCPWYAGDFAPIRTDQLAELLRARSCDLQVYPFSSSRTAMAAPAIDGVQPIFVNATAPRVDRQLAIRHEISHVTCGESGVFMSDDDFMTPHERRADLVALADLVPGWWIRMVRRSRTPWRSVLHEIGVAISSWGEGWPEQRLRDRAQLRLDLYRRQGV